MICGHFEQIIMDAFQLTSILAYLLNVKISECKCLCVCYLVYLLRGI